MTKINKMVMQGFKSFADRTELLFGDRFNVILGPNGSGKCVTGDTLITLSDGSILPIKIIFDSAEHTEGNLAEEIDDGKIIRGKGPEILSLNPKTHKIEVKGISAFVRRTSPENLVKIRTKTGRQITTTKYHPLFVLRKNEIVPIRADELKKGIKVAAANNNEVKGADNEEVFNKNTQTVQLLLKSDILWDEIVELEEIKSKEEWVYDLCVEKNHNFIANNIFVHNSNVLDALCFVLGKSSSKSMRAEKSANLIYNGGKTRPAAKKGEVSIFFDNTKKNFPIDEEEVKITRLVKQSGQSVYKINNKTRTRQEVVDLLSMAKINPDSYNIILQGDIVQLIEMSPIERRMIIEEIAGISVYEDKKQKALREMEKVEERLKEAEIILAEREKQLKDLKKDRDEAIKYKGLNDKITKNKASYTHLQIKKKKVEYDHHHELIKESKDEIEKLNKKIDELKQKIAEKAAEIVKINEDIEKKGEENQLKLNKEIEQLKVDAGTMKSRIDSHKEEIDKVGGRKKQLQESLAEISKKLDTLENEKKENDDDLKEKRKEIKEIEIKIADFKKKHSMDNLGEMEKKIEDLDKKGDEKQAQLQKLREEQQEFFRSKDKLEMQMQGLKEKIGKIAEIEKENKSQIENLKRKKEEFKKATLELNKLLNEDSSLAAQLNNAKGKILSTEEELSKLKIKNASVRESLAGGEAVQHILDEREKFGGVYGLVSEIGQVEAKYAMALEAAAGAKIKSIVVDDDAIAAKCINYLKSKKLGVASFLPLNKIKSVKKDQEIAKYAKRKGVLGFATDFIEHDPKFKDVFSYVFGNTLVVESIEVAREVGIGHAKMVTLDGDMTELSGAMHGGYRKKKEKGLSFQEKDLINDIKEHEVKLLEMQSVVSKVESKRKKNEDEIARLRSFKAGMEGDIISLERSLHLESGDVDVTKKQQSLIKEEIDKIDKDVDKMQEKISELTKELGKIKMDRGELRTEMGNLRSPTVLAEINAFEQKRTELKERLARSEAAAKHVGEQIDNIFGPEKEKTAKLLKSIDDEATKFKNDIAKMKKSIAEKEELLKDKEKKARQFYAQFKKSFEMKNVLNTEINELDKKIFLRGEERTKNELKINNAELGLSETTGQLQALEHEFKKYEGVELDEGKSEELLKKDLNNYERMMVNMGNVNMRALEVYDIVEREYNSLMDKKTKLKDEKDDVLLMMNEIESKKKGLFMKHYDIVNKHFKKFFSELSTKGEASMELENEEDPFQAGVLIKVKIIGNKFLDIRSLSGGEKTMTALAFIFAIQEHDPASFYVMDEVDAALDKDNSMKLANLIKKYCDRAQYIVISHNDNLLTEADILYGVSMNEHTISKVVSLKM